MNAELTAEQRARDVLNNLYSKPYPGSHAYTHAADAIAAAITEAAQAARETALEEAAKVCDDKADEWRAHYNKHRIDRMQQRFDGGAEVGSDECADAIRILARSAGAAAAEAQPAGDGAAGRAKG